MGIRGGIPHRRPARPVGEHERAEVRRAAHCGDSGGRHRRLPGHPAKQPKPVEQFARHERLALPVPRQRLPRAFGHGVDQEHRLLAHHVRKFLLPVAILEERRGEKQQGKPREQRRQIPRTHRKAALFRTRIRLHELRDCGVESMAKRS